jgi:putative ABC transport system substrate-binding protein
LSSHTIADPIAPLQVKAMERAAPSLGLSLHVQDIRTPEDIPAAFNAAANARGEGVVITEESMFIVHRAQLTELAARYKLPTVYPFLLPVTDANGLMAFAAKASELHRSAAAYVDRILKGAKPSNLPIQQPTQFELVINLKVAKALALTIPPPVLARATEVIE